MRTRFFSRRKTGCMRRRRFWRCWRESEAVRKRNYGDFDYCKIRRKQLLAGPMKFFAAALIAPLLFAQTASAITIVLDYSHDTATDNFFNTHATAKAALEKARDDIQAAITS